MIPPHEEISGTAPDVVWAEGIGVGVSEHPEGPVFAIVLHAPGGGKVMWSIDPIGALEYAAQLVMTVTEAMRNWESTQ